MKHANGGSCERCMKMLEEAHPMISFWFWRIQAVFPNVHTCRVWCGEEEQDRLVAEKKSLLKWPFSLHNRTTPDGVPSAEALDLFLLTSEGVAEFPSDLYREIAGWLKAQGAPIEWGGDWRTFKDLDHFQLAQRSF